MKLLRSQRNALFRSIVKCKLDPVNFKWKNYKSQFDDEKTIEGIKYEGTDFYFSFEESKNHIWMLHSPGERRIYDEKYVDEWIYVIRIFENWLWRVKKEVNEPDLWGNLSKYSVSFGSVPSAPYSNQGFTIQQLEHIKKSLESIEGYLREQGFISSLNEAFIIEKIKYLEESAKRQGFSDWYHTFLGAIISIGVSIAMEPEKAKQFFQFAKNILNGIIHLIK